TRGPGSGRCMTRTSGTASEFGRLPMTRDRDFLDLHEHHGVSPARRVRMVAAVVLDRNRLLMIRGPSGAWELPRARIAAGESPEHALQRELHEELGIDARVLEPVGVETHDALLGSEVEIHFIRCEATPPAGGPAAPTHRWVEPRELKLEDTAVLDRPFLASLGARGSPG